MKKSSKKYFGFTLVELIIAITILAILATIAFVSFQNYTSQTRDTKRLSDLNQISKGVEIFQVGAGVVPAPDNPKTLTGGNSTLLVGKINSKVLKTLSNNILDPVSGTEYTYATIGNGKYYQIGADSENLVSSIFTNTFADSKSTIVKGNYLFDPSLPSLIISSGSSLYDPNNCFVINGGTNLVSNTTNCTPKSSISLKNYDSSLVGYWDMESSGTINKIKDLSGNGNDGILSGTTLPTLTGGYIGSGYYFSGGVAIIGNDLTLNFSNKITISTINKGLKINSPYPRIISNRHFNTCYMDCYQYRNDPVESGSCLGIDYKGHGINAFGGLFVTYTGGTATQVSDLRISNSINLSDYFITTMVFDTDTIYAYVNGVLISKYKQDGFIFNKYTDTTSAYRYIYLGGLSVTSKKRDFVGIIDEVKIYNRALSDDEILQQAKTAGF